MGLSFQRATDGVALAVTAALLACLACYINMGCAAAANTGRVGTAEVEVEVNEIPLSAELEAALVKLETTIADESKRMTETTQKAVVAVSSVDNSTADKVVNRAAIFGLIILGLSYPVGKFIWLLAQRGHQAVKNGRRK